MPTAGEVIWASLQPSLKIGLTVCAGFSLTKAGFFPPPASRGFSQVCLNVALPCLIFSSIVPSFNSDNISALGPLIMTAILYEFLGLCMAIILRTIFWVPRNFQWGILICGTMSNWGNLPTAIVQSVSTKTPFNPATDQALGVGFVSIFIAVYNVTFFTGLYKVCAWDFIEPEGGYEHDDIPVGFVERMRRHQLNIKRTYARLRHGRRSAIEEEKEERRDDRLRGADLKHAVVEGVEKGESTSMAQAFELPKVEPAAAAGSGKPDVTRLTAKPLALTTSITRQLSAAETESISCAPLPSPGGSSGCGSSASAAYNRKEREASRRLDPIPASRAHSPTRATPRSIRSNHSHHSLADDGSLHHQTQSKHLAVLSSIGGILKSIITPVTTSLLLALVCALVPPIKSLFVDNVEGWSGTRMPYAPDGTPILAWIQSTAVFLGNITVPGGLILLGASFARLKRPESWSNLPLSAIFGMLLSKMVILPVFGIAFVQSLSAHTTLYPKEDKMLRFVAMLLSGTPTAVNQLVVTQLCAPEGGADTLAAFLLPQYCVMFILSTALTAVSLVFVS